MSFVDWPPNRHPATFGIDRLREVVDAKIAEKMTQQQANASVSPHGERAPRKNPPSHSPRGLTSLRQSPKLLHSVPFAAEPHAKA